MAAPKPTGCCDEASILDFSKIQVPDMLISWLDCNLWIAVAMMILPVVFWTTAARFEYRKQMFSKPFDSARFGCVVLGAMIFGIGLYRDYRFNLAVESQPVWRALQYNWVLWSGFAAVFVGTILVLSSFWALGFFGTFLGDYFGILMDNKVTGFPFNILENPMYWGTTLNFFGMSLIKSSQAGLFLTLILGIVYKFAIRIEGPFTEMIYRERDKKAQ